MTPSIGRIVLYQLSKEDANAINRRRTNLNSISERVQKGAWPIGAQAHVGNIVSAGYVYPCIIVRVWPNEFGQDLDGINGQVLLDGTDTLWVTSVKEGIEPGTWGWPSRQ